MGNPLRNKSSLASFLCYHSIAEEGPRYLTIAPRLFERQLDQIGARGLRTGDLPALEAAAGGHLRERTAFLTFDDGFRNNYSTMLPILRERGARAFSFVLPPLVDAGAPLAWPEVSAWQREYPETMRSMTWPMVEELAEAGIEVGSHTLSHVHLPRLGPDRLRDELLDSRRAIETRLGHCTTIAYPFGEWDGEVLAASADCGYSYAFTLPTRTGQRRAGPLSIPRINVDYRDIGRRFDLKLGRAGKSLFLSPAVTSLRNPRHALAHRGQGGASQRQ